MVSNYSLLSEDEKEKRRVAHRKWMAKQPGRRKEYYKEYDKSRLKGKMLYNKKRREELPELHKEYQRRNYVKNHQNFTPQSPEYKLWKAASSRSKKKEVPFTILPEEVVIPEFCPILGIKLEQGVGKSHDASPSLDRVRPELGYVTGNVAVISHLANTIKSFGTAEQHRRIADWIDSFS